MKKQKIYLDTNIVRRCLEGETKHIQCLDCLKDNYVFVVHEFVLFELLDQIDRANNINKAELELKLRLFLRHYVVEFDKITRDADKVFNSFVTYGMFGYKIVKRHLLYNFSDYISQIYGNIIGIIYTAIYNQNRYKVPVYVGNFVKHEVDLSNLRNIKNRYQDGLNKEIMQAYQQNKKVGGMIKKFLKDFSIHLLAVYLESERYGLQTDNEKYNMIVKELQEKYNKAQLKDVLRDNVDEKILKIDCIDGTDKLEYQFYNYYIHKLFSGTGGYDYNDLADFKIFISAFRRGDIYLTNDSNIFKVYEKVFKENENIIDFIKRSKLLLERL